MKVSGIERQGSRAQHEAGPTYGVAEGGLTSTSQLWEVRLSSPGAALKKSCHILVWCEWMGLSECKWKNGFQLL